MTIREKLLSGLLLLIILVIGWLHFKKPVPVLTLHPGIYSESGLQLPDYGHGNIITVKPNGVTTVTPKVTGFPFDVGISGAFAGTYSQLYLTTEIYYYRHMELLAGVGATYPNVHPRVMIAIGYRLPWKRLDNLSIFAGYDLQKPIVGVMARFGSN